MDRSQLALENEMPLFDQYTDPLSTPHLQEALDGGFFDVGGDTGI
jgi:hypothetical protein